MSKKILILIIGLIAISTWSFFIWKNEQKVEMGPVETQSNDNVGSQNDIEIQDNTKFGTRLNEQEIKDIKENNFFVWYKIPEIGIRFKVAPDAADDLRYSVKYVSEIGERNTNQNTIAIYLYSKSVVDFLGNESCFLNNSILSKCSSGALSRLSIERNNKLQKDTGKPACRDTEVIANINDDVVCFVGPQSPVLFESQYEQYLKEKAKGKNFSVYLDTAEQIK